MPVGHEAEGHILGQKAELEVRWGLDLLVALAVAEGHIARTALDSFLGGGPVEVEDLHERLGVEAQGQHRRTTLTPQLVDNQAHAGRAALGLVAISRLVDLDPTTTHRLLHTMEERGFVSQSPIDGKYSLGLRAFQVGNAVTNVTILRQVARQFIQVLMERTGETWLSKTVSGPPTSSR